MMITITILSFWFGMATERFLTDLAEIGKPSYEVNRVYFPNTDTSLFIKTKTWGITGNHKATVISTKPSLEFHPDSISEYIISGFEDIYYKANNDTLFVYNSYIPQIPKYFDSEIKVKFVKQKKGSKNRLKQEYQRGIKKVRY